VISSPRLVATACLSSRRDVDKGNGGVVKRVRRQFWGDNTNTDGGRDFRLLVNKSNLRFIPFELPFDDGVVFKEITVWQLKFGGDESDKRN